MRAALVAAMFLGASSAAQAAWGYNDTYFNRTSSAVYASASHACDAGNRAWFDAYSAIGPSISYSLVASVYTGSACQITVDSVQSATSTVRYTLTLVTELPAVFRLPRGDG